MNQELVDNIIQDDKISSDINKYVDIHFNEVANWFKVGVYKYTVRMDHSKKKYRFNGIEKKSLGKLFDELFDEKGHILLYDIMGIEPVFRKVEIVYNNMPFPGDNNEMHCTSLEKIKGMKFVSSVLQEGLQVILLSTGEDVSKKCGVSADIISVDHFDCNIVYNVKMDIKDDIDTWEITDNTDSSIICKVYGIEYDASYPMWIEYILMSYIFYDLNNEKMAFFTAFAALDQFIENVYSRLPILYRQVFFDDLGKISEHDGEVLNARRNKYMNLSRRLIDEKLHDILKERFGNDTIYLPCYNQLQKYERIRNMIAHCEEVDVNGKYIELLKNILNIVYLVGYGKDILSVFIEKE